jgi:hypothetical protein
MIAALDRPLPDAVVAGTDLATAIDALRRATSVSFFINWRALEAAGVQRDTPIPDRALGGMALGDAIMAVCADVHPPLECEADEDMVVITTAADASRDTLTRTYDVRDLVEGGGTTQLEAQLRSHVSPGSWRGDHADAFGTLRGLSGQLIVSATPTMQHELATHLNELRLRRSRVRFAKRAGMLIGGATAAAALTLLGHSLVLWRRRLRNGLCACCGYDLRMTPQCCPECGTISHRPAPA